ncbi:MAG TPA: nucleotidyltransferase domain-containing protein [Gemmataceae bacterium]|nr:nucleotidyltransferase domain-containing protein [Gemmataceae bacterium]
MDTRKRARRKNNQSGLYYPNIVPLSAIKRFARHIVERFHPRKIILFGSYAYGTPTLDSDVDILVVMPTRNQVEQAVRIDEAIEERGFPLDLLVRTPKTLEKSLRWGDGFMKEIVTRGKILYETSHAPVGAQGGKRRRRRAATAQVQTPPVR